MEDQVIRNRKGSGTSAGVWLPEALEDRRLLSATGAEMSIPRVATKSAAIVVPAATSVAGEILNDQWTATLPAGTTALPTATIRWGDGGRAEQAVITRGSGSEVIKSWQHTYRRAGHYTASIVFSLGRKILERVRQHVTILRNTPDGLNLRATAGQPFTGTLGTLVYLAGARPGRTTIDWGDGTQSDGTDTDASDTSLQVSGTHTYLRRGTYRVRVTADYLETQPVDPQFAIKSWVIDSTMLVRG
jgi:hypothetical protein